MTDRPDRACPTARTDQDLLAVLRRSPEEGLRLVFEAHAEPIRRRLQRSFGALVYDDEIDSAVSEALVVLHRKRHDSTIQKIRAYMHTVARNHCVKTMKQRLDRPASLQALEWEPEDRGRSERSAFARFLSAKVEGLSELEQALFRIDACSDRSAKSVADELGSTPSSIDSLRYRRKRRVLAWLEEWDLMQEEGRRDG